MIHFIPCEARHIRLIDAQNEQISEKAFYANVTEELVANSLALSCWVDEICVGAGGVRPIWHGRGAAWAILSCNARPAMLAIARKLRFVLDTMPLERIEMTVRANFVPGRRLAHLLGFRLETPLPMARFYPDGEAAFLYARIMTP